MLVYKDGQVKHYKEMFPNISFPASGPDDGWLSTHGIFKVSVFKPHTATQKLVSCDPYIEGGWAYTVRVEDKTAEELASDNASKAAQVRSQRDALIAQSDWMVIRAQETGVPMDEEWATYRQALRDITSQESFPNVTWPTNPDSNPELLV